MGGTAAIVLIIGALCVDGSGAASPDASGPDGAAQAERAKGARRRRARTRRVESPRPPSDTRGARRAAPSGQPAHMAPQPEDIPPVKPPKSVPPKPDKSNPS